MIMLCAPKNLGIFTLFVSETGERKQNIDYWHLVFSYIQNWKAYKSLIFLLQEQ